MLFACWLGEMNRFSPEIIGANQCGGERKFMAQDEVAEGDHANAVPATISCAVLRRLLWTSLVEAEATSHAPHLIANWALVALVMRHELLRRSHNLRVLRVGLKSIHGNDHALLHTIWYHFADKWTHGLFQGLQSYGVTWATGYEVLSTVAFLCLWTCDRYTTSSRKCEILGKYQLVWPLKLTDITTIPPFSTWPYIKLIYSNKSVEEYK